jgi:hypothetical protein
MRLCPLHFWGMFTILSAFLVIPLQSIGQHHESGEANNSHVQHHSMKGAHRIGLGLGHTSISEGRKDGKTQWLPLASWSLNYDYWISDKWAIGLQNDIILETFIVEKHGEEEIERKNPLSMVPVAMYKFSGRWSVFSGAGIEFSKAKNLGLTRLGVEYGVPISKNGRLAFQRYGMQNGIFMILGLSLLPSIKFFQ